MSRLTSYYKLQIQRRFDKVMTGKVFAGSLVVLFTLPDPALAYIDPGSGSYLFQILIAGILAGFIFLKNSWLKIFFFFKNLFSKSDQKDEGDE